MKYKYHLTPNAFEELPGMEEPNVDDEVDENIEGTYKERCIWYLQHIESLHDGKHKPMIPGSPECREVFSDGQVVEEGKEIQIMPYSCNEVHCRCGYSTPVAQHCVSRRDRIVPVLPKEEQWKIHYDYAGNLAYHLGITINGELWEKKALPYLEKFYHITRK